MRKPLVKAESFLKSCPPAVKPTQRTREEKQMIEDRIYVYAARVRMKLPLFPKESEGART